MIPEKVKAYIGKLTLKDKKELSKLLNTSILEEINESAPDLIRNTFEITGDKKDILTHPEIEFIIKENDFDITRFKLKTFLKSYGAKDWRDSVGRGLSGVKIRD